jgi:hypothetical protein
LLTWLSLTVYRIPAVQKSSAGVLAEELYMVSAVRQIPEE